MKDYIRILSVISVLFLTLSCKKDAPQELKNDNDLVHQAIDLLSGDTIVLSTRAKMSAVDKTLLKEGCPVKYKFQWLDDKKKMNIFLMKFQVGTMPFAVVYYANIPFSELNEWEKEEYHEDGWIKFHDENGVVTAFVPDGVQEPNADGAAMITGYVNPILGEIEFLINYNMMNVSSHCYRQKIDKSRLANFDKEFKKFEEDLKKYKKEHGF